MARARNIKPGFFTNDVLGEMSPLARLLFAGLWTICDRAGRVEDRPKKIKAEVLPYDSCDADTLLADLQRGGFISRYEAGGVKVIQVLAWDKHQNPHIKEAASSLPAPDKNGASTVQEQCDTQPEPELAGLIPDSGFLTTDSTSPTVQGEAAAPPKPPRKQSPDAEAPEDVDPQVWSDWVRLRRGHKAQASATAVSEARKEAVKAEMTLESFLRIWCMRGSRGLQADWLKPSERQQFVSRAPPPEPAWRTEERARNLAFLGPAARKPQSNVIDLESLNAPPALRDR